jgi:cytochrome c oxidase assembly protein subunit 15
VLGWVIAGLAAVVMVLGHRGDRLGAALGDADRPARLGLDPQVASWVHADAVWLFLGLVTALVVALRLTDGPEPAAARARWLLG